MNKLYFLTGLIIIPLYCFTQYISHYKTFEGMGNSSPSFSTAYSYSTGITAYPTLPVSENYIFPSEQQTDIEGFILYPNPVTQGKVTILTAKNLSREITVFDVLGKPVLHKVLRGNVLDVSGLNTGVYIIEVTENTKTVRRKLVIR